MGGLASIALAGLFLGCLGSGLAAALALASRRLYVYEDPRIDVLGGATK